MTVNNFGFFKRMQIKLQTLISEAILIKRYNSTLHKQLTKLGLTYTHFKAKKAVALKFSIKLTTFAIP